MKLIKCLTLLYFLVNGLSIQAQTDRRFARNIEKQAIRMADGSIVFEGTQMNNMRVLSSTDSNYGKLTGPDTSGPGNLQAIPVESAAKAGKRTELRMQKVMKGLYCSSFEVSNKDYRLFIENVKQRDTLDYNLYIPDTNLWKNYYLWHMTDWYYHHDNYADFPVVNIKHEQAVVYCMWLTQMYNSNKNRKYKKVLFRLPTEAEWVYFYLGGKDAFDLNKGGSIMNNRGMYLANFRVIQQGRILPFTHNRSLHDSIFSHCVISNKNWGFEYAEGGFITTPVESFFPSRYGLYNMMGNASEFVAEYGYTKGGSWSSTGYFLMPGSRQTYLGSNSASPERGFRWVMEVVEE